MTLMLHYPSDDADWVAKTHAEHYLQPWSRQGSRPKVIAGASGSWFWDSSGKHYLDFQSQLVNVNLGHQHPKIIQAIKNQADRLCYISPRMGLDVRSELAAMIKDITPDNISATFFSTGGAAANELAIRLAKHYTGRRKVIVRYRSYHGATDAALSLSGEPRHHLTYGDMPGVVRLLDPYCYRCPMGYRTVGSCPTCQGDRHLEEILQYEDPGTVAAILIEPVVGFNGIIVPPDGYLQNIRKVCDQHGILMIADEVMVGYGRTGKWFAVDHWGVQPDIITSAKGINSGYVPLGMMSISKTLAAWLKDYALPGGLTYAGHPLACAAAVATIRAMQDEEALENATLLGQKLRDRLHDMAQHHPSIGDIRGLGMFNGVELVKNRETRDPLVSFAARDDKAVPMNQMMKAAMDKGLYLSFFSNFIPLTPPMNISEDDLMHGLNIFDEVLEIADGYCD